MAYEISEVVTQIGEISIEGNIIPHEWYTHLKNDKGKLQTNAILILAEIVYWYRPVSVYDNQGQLLGYSKKFKEDLLQRSYKDLGEKFGFSQKQIREALIFLESKNLVFREFRDIKVSGQVLNNVMYIRVNAEEIRKITQKKINLNLSLSRSQKEKNASENFQEAYSQQLEENRERESTKKEPPAYKKGTIPLQKGKQVVLKMEIGDDKKVNTNTKTTTKITPHILKINDRDWSLTFSKDEKDFLTYLLKIIPANGKPIDKNSATWWIKNYGKEKVKIALKVYWQQVEKAKINKSVPMPKSIGAYVRQALNDNLRPSQETDDRNKKFAKLFKVQNKWTNLTITEKYCRVEGIGKEWYFSLPENLFQESIKSSYLNFGNF